MNILFVHDHPFVKVDNKVYSTGGLPNTVWDNYLHNNEDQIYVYARNLQSRTAKSISSRDNVNFSLSKVYTSPKDYFIKKAKLSKEINQVAENIDVAIIRLPSFLGLIAIKECKKRNIPYLVEVVGNVYDSISNYGNVFGKLLANYIDGIVKKEIYNAPYAIYVTKHYLQECYPCKNIVEYASDVEISAGNYNKLSERINKIKNSQQQPIVVGTIGNLEVKYKGYEVLIKAIGLLKKNGLRVIYRIAGPGSNIELLEIAEKNDVKDQIEFTGSLNREQVFEYLDNLDIYIHPSFQEGLPRVVVEAMSCALPVLASTIGGIPELIPMKYLHKPGDYMKLYNDLKSLIDSKEELLSMAENNWNKALEYDKEFLVAKRRSFFADFYNNTFLNAK